MARHGRDQRAGSGLALLVVGALVVAVGVSVVTRIWGLEPEIVSYDNDVPSNGSGSDADSVHQEREVLARMEVAASHDRSLRAVDESGAPIADVLVGFRSRAGKRSVTGVTDAAGRVNLQLSGVDDAPTLEVYTDRTGPLIARLSNGESRSYSVTLPQRLAVLVVDEHGVAAPGAEIWALTTGPVEVCRRLGVADAAGQLLLRGIGSGVLLRAESESGSPGRWTRVESGEVTLATGSSARTVVVEVRNEAGQALDGAIVRTSGHGANWSDVCGIGDDGRGCIRYGGPMPLEGRKTKLVVEAVGYAPEPVLLELAPQLPTVVCERGHDVRFLIKAMGKVLSGAHVTWQGCVSRVAESNEEGYCQLWDLPVGISEFSVSYSGAIEERRFPVRAGVMQYSWDLKQTQSIGGRVAVAGKPASGWTIVLAEWLTDDVRRVQSDARGGFLFLDCPSETGYELIVREPVRNVSVWRRRCAPGERLDVALPASTLSFATISGVFRGPGEAPVEEDVIVESVSGDLRLVQVSGGGVFSFENLPAGDYEVSAVPFGWKTPLVVTCRLYPGQVESVELRSGEPAALSVEVTDVPGSPERLAAALWFDGAWRNLPKTGPTTWAFGGVAPGDHLLRLYGMAPTTTAVTLKPGETESVRFEYAPAQRVEVILSGPAELDSRTDLEVYFVEGKCEIRARRIPNETTWVAHLRNGTRYSVDVRVNKRLWARGEVSVPGSHDQNAVLLESPVVEMGW